MTNTSPTELQASLVSLKQKLPNNFQPRVALIVGTGLSDIVSPLNIIKTIGYDQIDGFPQSTAPGHAGCLTLARHKETDILVFEGRFHMYEGWTAKQSAIQVNLSKLLGASEIIITNAVGALNSDFKPGDVMLVTDHINFTGCSPLRGENDEQFGPRFPDMSQAYSRLLQEISKIAFKPQSIPLREGIYAGVFGPELETSAERRFLRIAGADVVGMSLIMETIAAVHCGMQVLGLTAVTNSATGGADQQPDTIEEVLGNAKISAQKIRQALPQILEQIAQRVVK